MWRVGWSSLRVFIHIRIYAGVLPHGSRNLPPVRGSQNDEEVIRMKLSCFPSFIHHLSRITMLSHVLSMSYFGLFASALGLVPLDTWPKYSTVRTNRCKIRYDCRASSPIKHINADDSSIRMTKQLKADLQPVLEKQRKNLVNGGHLLDLPLDPFCRDANITSEAEKERLLALDR